MKNLVFLISFVSLSSLVIGQTVNIPDQSFKNLLLEGQYLEMLEGPGWNEVMEVLVTQDINQQYIDIDVNNNNEIEENEAQLVYVLNITDQQPFPSIQDLTGIEKFVNLLSITIGGQSFSTIDLSQLTQLQNLTFYENSNLTFINPSTSIEWIYCNSNALSSGIDVTNLGELKTLALINEGLSSINLQNNLLLESLDVRSNSLTNIDIENNLNLSYLAIQDNSLTNLDLMVNTNLAVLFCQNNDLSSLDLTPNINLTNIYCSNNQISNLDISSNPLVIRLFCQNNSLQSLNIKNSSSFYYDPSTIETFDFSNNPDLSYICADTFEFDEVQSRIAQYGNTNVNLNSECNILNLEENSLDDFHIYPNPAMDYFTVENYPIDSKISISDLSGKQLYTTITSETSPINIEHFKPGIYIVTIAKGPQSKSQKLIKY